MAAAIPFPRIKEATMPATSQKLSRIVRPTAIGAIRKPVTMKKIRANNALPKKCSFSFAGWSPTAVLTAPPARKDDVRQVDEVSEHAGHHHYGQHRDKIARLIVPQFAQDPGAAAADTYQNQRHEDGDLDDLQRKAGYRKPGGVGRNTNPEDDQR